jgi:hypothetical protein
VAGHGRHHPYGSLPTAGGLLRSPAGDCWTAAALDSLWVFCSNRAPAASSGGAWWCIFGLICSHSAPASSSGGAWRQAVQARAAESRLTLSATAAFGLLCEPFLLRSLGPDGRDGSASSGRKGVQETPFFAIFAPFRGVSTSKRASRLASAPPNESPLCGGLVGMPARPAPGSRTLKHSKTRPPLSVAPAARRIHPK